MIFNYNLDKLFADFEKQFKEEQEKSANNPIESPEDAPETQEVALATSKTTEDKHGGDEASKQIKGSPNSAKEGEEENKENKTEKTENTGKEENGKGKNGENNPNQELAKESEGVQDSASRSRGK